MIIKKLADAREFIEEFEKYANINPNSDKFEFTFEDGALSYLGNTDLIKDENGDFYQFSYGVNWRDREESYIDLPIEYVWEQRKWINKELRNRRNNQYF